LPLPPAPTAIDSGYSPSEPGHRNWGGGAFRAQFPDSAPNGFYPDDSGSGPSPRCADAISGSAPFSCLCTCRATRRCPACTSCRCC